VPCSVSSVMSSHLLIALHSVSVIHFDSHIGKPRGTVQRLPLTSYKIPGILMSLVCSVPRNLRRRVRADTSGGGLSDYA
jgi:hypothetical protein